jgi:hypothetical protein
MIMSYNNLYKVILLQNNNLSKHWLQNKKPKVKFVSCNNKKSKCSSKSVVQSKIQSFDKQTDVAVAIKRAKALLLLN